MKKRPEAPSEEHPIYIHKLGEIIYGGITDPVNKKRYSMITILYKSGYKADKKGYSLLTLQQIIG